MRVHWYAAAIALSGWLSPSIVNAASAPVCLPPIVKAVHTQLHEATVVYDDRCQIATKTTITHLKGNFLQMLPVTPAHEFGERTFVLSNLEPGTQQCVSVKVQSSSGTFTSPQVCATTRVLGGTTANRVSKLDGVGAISNSPTAALGQSFSASVSRVHQFVAKQNGSCRAIAIRDSSGNYLADGSGCSGVSVYLTAGEMYFLYGSNGVSAQNTPARCDIQVDGAAFANVFCGWRKIAYSGLQAAERIQAVHLPPEDFLPAASFQQWKPPTMRMVRLPTKGSTTLKNSFGNFVARGAEQALPTSGESALVLVGYATDLAVSIPARIVRNDVTLADRDGDGLGDAVEANAQLCDDPTKTRNGFDCSRAYDQRDTDGDGISDGWEVLGRRKPANLAGDDQPLAYWGANPRHKDLFWELDFTQTMPTSPLLKFTAKAARLANAGLAFKGNAFNTVVSDITRRQANALDLGNPDGNPGIALHVDNGVYPESVQEWSMYGDWGGYDATLMTTDDCTVNADGSIASCKVPQATQIWDTAMSEIRFGIFKWGLTFPFDNGGNAWGFPVDFGIIKEDERQAELLLHEGGHTLGLDHSGPWQMDSSRFRPGYDPEGGGFNCEPFYAGLMNYIYEGRFGDANEPQTFADDFVINHSPVNNMRLVERNAIAHYIGSPLPSVATFLTRVLRDMSYPVTEAGDVDWNRDGVIADTPVIAGSNRMGGGCDEARANKASFGGRWNGRKSLSAASFNGVVQLVGVDLNSNAWWSGVRFNAACKNFEPEQCHERFPKESNQIALFADVTGVDVAVLTRANAAKRAVAVSLKEGTANIKLAYTDVATTNASSQWSATKVFSAVNAASGAPLALAGEPELVAVPATLTGNISTFELAKLFVRADGNQVYMASVTESGSNLAVGEFQPVLYTAANGVFRTLTVADPVASVGGLHMYPYDMKPSAIQPGVTGRKLHLFVPQGSEVLALQQVNGAIFAEKGSIVTGRIQDNSKPVPVFIARSAGDADRGQLHLYYAKASGVLSFARAFERPVNDDQSRTEYVVRRFGDIDSSKIAGPFVAATAEPGVDEQARLFWAQRALDDKGNPLSFHGNVWMIPRPDNIYDKDMWGFNDWLTLKHTVCFQVSRGGDHKRSRVVELGGSPINCAPAPVRDPTHPGL